VRIADRITDGNPFTPCEKAAGCTLTAAFEVKRETPDNSDNSGGQMSVSREVVIQLPVQQAEDFQQHWSELADLLYPGVPLQLPSSVKTDRLDAGMVQWVIPTLQAASAIAGMIAAVSTFLNNRKGKMGVKETGRDLVQIGQVRSDNVVMIVQQILAPPSDK
jgi:hypothetical protein